MPGEQPNYSNAPGVRKDILSFKETDLRRKRLFICLKMLGILPCHPQYKDRQFYINIKLNQDNSAFDPDSMMYIKPQRLHDELIASHASCCQHSTPFFSHYHRNLMVYTEFQLNFADQYLRFNNDAHNQNKDQWAAVIKQYRDLIEHLKNDPQYAPFEEKVMCHYWNPTNYTVNQYPGQTSSYNVPIQLLPKSSDKYELIDKLFQKVNSHLPWEINLRTRFYHCTPEQYKAKKPLDDFPDFLGYDDQFSLTKQELLIVSGESNPRSQNLDMIQNFFDNFVRKSNDDYNGSPIPSLVAQLVSNQNYKFFLNQGKGEVLPIYSLTSDQYNINFGTQTHKDQWLSPTEIQQIYRKGIKFGGLDPVLYNKNVPHYQFVAAYEKSGNGLISQYFGGASFTSSPKDGSVRMQASHNTMHNNTCFIMSDSSFSLTNLIFYLYHSWIDYQLEVKIRRLNTPTAYIQAINELSYRRERTVYDVFNNDNVNSTYTVGSYRIPEWVNPRIGVWRWNLGDRSWSAEQRAEYTRQQANLYFKNGKIDPKSAFKYSFSNSNLTFRDILVSTSSKTIRRSDQMNEIYKKQYQVDSPYSQYSYFQNLKGYSFDYFYQVYDNGKTLLMNQPNGPILPSYLDDIRKSLTLRDRRIELFTAPKRFAMLETKEHVPAQISRFTPLPVKEKILQSPILALGRYSSFIKSGLYFIKIHFQNGNTNNIKNLIQSNPRLSEMQQQYIEKGFNIQSLSILSKGKGSKGCPKCTPTKKFWIDAEVDLRQSYPEIWRALNLYLIDRNKVIYSSQLTQKQNQDQQIQTHEIIRFSAQNKNFTGFEVFEGAEQIQFEVNLNSKSTNQVSVKLDLEYYSMLTNKMHGVVSKILYNIQVPQSQKKFSFYKIIDLSSSSAKNHQESFDKYYFKKVRGEVKIGETVQNFSFDIDNYHRLVRYVINLTQQEKNEKDPMTIKVQDIDYNMKLDYYTSWQDDL